jgi:chromosome segregation ATPase
MNERSIAGQLSLLATEVDSLTKTLARAETERDREEHRRRRVDAQAQALRQQLLHAQRRAKAAERALADAGARIAAIKHEHEVRERELLARLDEAEQAKKVLRHEVEQTERERRALQLNLREVLSNLRHAAENAPNAQVQRPVDESTLVPDGPTDNGW